MTCPQVLEKDRAVQTVVYVRFIGSTFGGSNGLNMRCCRCTTNATYSASGVTPRGQLISLVVFGGSAFQPISGWAGLTVSAG